MNAPEPEQKARGGWRAGGVGIRQRSATGVHCVLSTSPRPPGRVPHKAQYAPSSLLFLLRFRSIPRPVLGQARHSRIHDGCGKSVVARATTKGSAAAA